MSVQERAITTNWVPFQAQDYTVVASRRCCYDAAALEEKLIALSQTDFVSEMPANWVSYLEAKRRPAQNKVEAAPAPDTDLSAPVNAQNLQAQQITQVPPSQPAPDMQAHAVAPVPNPGAQMTSVVKRETQSSALAQLIAQRSAQLRVGGGVQKGAAVSPMAGKSKTGVVAQRIKDIVSQRAVAYAASHQSTSTCDGRAKPQDSSHNSNAESSGIAIGNSKQEERPRADGTSSAPRIAVNAHSATLNLFKPNRTAQNATEKPREVK